MPLVPAARANLPPTKGTYSTLLIRVKIGIFIIEIDEPIKRHSLFF